MGMCLSALSASSYDKVMPETRFRPLPNPDPTRFSVVRSKYVGRYLLVLVNYPDCTNYEGNKILMYDGVSLGSLLAQGSCDPHFSDNSQYFSPVARFVPTDAGWAMAEKCATVLSRS